MSWKTGDECFLDDGAVAEYVATLPNDEGYVIRRIYERENAEHHVGAPVTVKTIFWDAPLEKYDARILAKQTEFNELSEKLAAKRQEMREFEKEERDNKAQHRSRQACRVLLAVAGDLLGRVRFRPWPFLPPHRQGMTERPSRARPSWATPPPDAPVVSDEMVERAKVAFFASQDRIEPARDAMRAALLAALQPPDQ